MGTASTWTARCGRCMRAQLVTLVAINAVMSTDIGASDWSQSSLGDFSGVAQGAIDCGSAVERGEDFAALAPREDIHGTADDEWRPVAVADLHLPPAGQRFRPGGGRDKAGRGPIPFRSAPLRIVLREGWALAVAPLRLDRQPRTQSKDPGRRAANPPDVLRRERPRFMMLSDAGCGRHDPCDRTTVAQIEAVQPASLLHLVWERPRSPSMPQRRRPHCCGPYELTKER